MTIADKIIRAKTDYDEVYEAGKQAEYDVFWDNHPIAKGNCNGSNLFSGAGWNDITFKPKYDIKPDNCYMIFKESRITNLVKSLKECGVVLDFSRVNSLYYAFNYATTEHIGEVILTNNAFTTATFSTGMAFSYCHRLHTIDKIVVNNEGTTIFNADMFTGSTALRNITFEGIIGKSINFQWCPLSRESITNIIEHLSSTAIGQTCTFRKSAKEEAFTSDEWEALKATKPNWSIVLI